MDEQIEILKELLSNFLSNEEREILALVLYKALHKGKISYSEAKKIDKNIEEILLIAFEWKLLVPISSIKGTLSWDDKIMSFKRDEIYRMPNISKYLIQEGLNDKQWNIKKAVLKLFRAMGEKDWNKMGDLIEALKKESDKRFINAFQIKEACKKIGLAHKIDSIIASLKGAGIISPHLSSISEITTQAKNAPFYEINPLILL